jgi:molybdate transport system substrate-binding protein
VTALRPVVVGALVVAASLTLASCGGGGDAAVPERTTVRVSAASSLQEALTALERTFERQHRDVDVVVTFGASSALATQLVEGAPADVFVSADEVTMQKVRDAGRVAGPPSVVAHNRITIVVERGNPKGVESLHDLGREDVVVVLCAAEVPCGRLAAAALAKSGVAVAARSYEENVKGVLSKVTLGEADAGIVYESDARAGGEAVDDVPIDFASEAAFQAVYPAAVLTGAPPAAATWVAFLRSAAAQRVFAEHGFLAP